MPQRRRSYKVCYPYNGNIILHTAEPYREGNALIAAEDRNGKILWSWHVWLTDQPSECVYANDAGVMMDRNLGATSATPGDVGALDLLYQWIGKIHFWDRHIRKKNIEAKSTIRWPSPVRINFNVGTIPYTIEHPTTYIADTSDPDDLWWADWIYPDSDNENITRWDSQKTIYDPCPAGWRVPDGGDNGI